MAFVKAKLRAIPRRLKYEWAYKTKFHLTKEEFDFFDYDEEEFKRFAEQYDLIVVGSDTILIQLERGEFQRDWLSVQKGNDRVPEKRRLLHHINAL